MSLLVKRWIVLVEEGIAVVLYTMFFGKPSVLCKIVHASAAI